MATFTLTKSTKVATLKELFNTEVGAKLRIYSGRSQAEDSATLGELGLTNEGEFECRASLTVGSFIERMQSEHGLKVKVYTCDEWVAVLDGLTLESAGKVKKNAVKADMESMIAYQRTDDGVETAVVDIKKSATYGEYTINIALNNSVTVLKGGVACDNAKGALREVAALVGFEVDAAWTTQQLGSKLVDVINNGETASNVEAAKAAEEAKAEAEKAAAETAKAATPAATSASKKDGELPGRFTINSKGDKICFSRGLLQFNPAKYEFRFAENQYDIIGKDNEKIAPNYDGWIDLFGWGTSGYMGCQPTETSKNTSDYGPAEGDIAGTNYDWGVYNPITNGGNKEGLWRTPTADEWEYLMNNRPNASKLRVLCTVCGRNGYMILPDDFWNNRLRMPLDITADNYSVNQYTAEQWSQLEALGVVFMPRVGWRDPKIYSNGGCVWLASTDSSSYACISYFSISCICSKYLGRGVRLIKDVK